jgi:hypothetical protein
MLFYIDEFTQRCTIQKNQSCFFPKLLQARVRELRVFLAW